MATATQLFTTLGISEPHIVINSDRSITVPEELEVLAVQYDHNIETVTFDCPRYWDGYDLSELDLRINYECPDKYRGASDCKNITIDEDDENVIHFDWTIMREVTQKPGTIKFIVCAQRVTEELTVENCWHSRLCKQCSVVEGLDCAHGAADGEIVIPDNYNLSDVLYCFDSDDDDYIPIPGVDQSISVSDDGNGNVTISIE